MARATQDYALIESLLYSGGYQRLEQHVSRLHASAEALDFPLIDERVLDLLEEQAAHLGSGDFKIRLLLERDGNLWSSAEAIAASSGNLAVMLAEARVDSTAQLSAHKTTRRDLFERHAALVNELGLADVIFLNEREELAEAANSNVFVELDGELLTPPATAGILPGVYRQSVLETEANAREAVLTLADLERSSAVYLTNSVRGWRQVQLRPGWLRLQ